MSQEMPTPDAEAWLSEHLAARPKMDLSKAFIEPARQPLPTLAQNPEPQMPTGLSFQDQLKWTAENHIFRD